MKLDPTTAICDLDGTPIVEDGKPVDIGIIARRALLNLAPDEGGMAGAEKEKRFRLAMKLFDQSPVELSAEEVVCVKDAIGKAFMPLIVGRAFQILDPSE